MNMHAATADWDPIWATDNPPSKRWPLYTRGNVGEVFPEVVMPFTWGLFGQQAEDGWRAAFERMGLLMPGDMDPDDIKQKLRATGEREVPSRILGECVMAELRQLDQVAYVRFASVYRSFQDLDEFRAEIERISSPLSPLADSKEEEA